MATLISTHAWDQFIKTVPNAHVLQTSTWGKFKSQFGWSPSYLIEQDCGAQVLFRTLPLGYSIAYIPKGPLGKNWNQLWPEIDQLCKQKHTIMLIVEPDYWEPLPETVFSQWLGGFSPNPHTIQPRRTIFIDLSPDEEGILAAMKQKTRYNIRLAERKDVIVRETQDLQSFYDMMCTTGQRDGFALHNLIYYKKAYEHFAPLGQCALLQAEYQGTPLAALMVFAYQEQAWYFYGASTNAERNRMPTYALQWQAMRWAKAKGCTSYDLWGVPDFGQETLEADFSSRSDGLWGVYRFKRGFGGVLKRSAPAFIRIYRPLLYRAYTWLTNRQKPSQA